jgi:hypothetical protein
VRSFFIILYPEAQEESTRLLYQEIWSQVFDHLDVNDIMRLSRTSRRLHELSECYWDSNICLSRILRRYVSTDREVKEFRDMMHNTGAIISGSSALQIFARVHYDESDLDLYVEETKAYSVSLCLSGLGYSRLESNIATKDSLDPGDGYPGKTEIERVETFRRHESERIVQLINTVREPIFAVLQFHSSTSRRLRQSYL